MTSTIDGRKASGTAIVARKSVEALLKRQDEFELTFIHYEKTDDPIYEHGVREIILPNFWPAFINRRSLRQTWYLLTTKDRFDIFHWFQPRLYPFFWRAPARHLVVHVHSTDILRLDPFNLMVWVYKQTLRFGRKALSLGFSASAQARLDILKDYWFTPDQIVSLPNGAGEQFAPQSVESVALARVKYNLPEKFLMNVARLHITKNAFRTIRAFALYAKEHPESDVHFVNVGARGMQQDKVREFIDSSPYKDRIHLTRFVDDDDFAAFYAASKGLVFPLVNDGFGLPLLEAMASGIPTAVSKRALPEITNDDSILVDPESEQEIADAMHVLLSDEARRSSLIRHGFACAEKYSWRSMQATLLNHYRQLAALPGKSL